MDFLLHSFRIPNEERRNNNKLIPVKSITVKIVRLRLLGIPTVPDTSY
jgi:hypothetical protein